MATKTSDHHQVKRICTGHYVSCLTNTSENNQIFKPQPNFLFSIEDEYNLTSAYGASCKIYPASPLMDTDEPAHGWTIADDMEQYSNSFQDFPRSAIIGKDESAHGLNATSNNVNDSVDSQDSSTFDECDSELERSLRLSISSDDYLPRYSLSSVLSSASLRSSSRNSKAGEFLSLLFSDGRYYRKFVPIGPGFQAEVPEWKGPVNMKSRKAGVDSKKWLGTRVYPPAKRLKNAGTDTKLIGKGRSDSCSCVSPGSVACVKHHIHEGRICLQAEIGPAFQTWKFDEMGEFASKSWTLKEQSTFETLVRKNPLSNEASFWKLTFKRFPNKCRKSIVRFYYNVFKPRRMSIQTRFSLHEIDSDDD